MRKWRFRTGLQQKFVTSLLLAGLLPGIAALIATYLTSTNILKTSIGANFQEIASAVAKKVEIIVDQDITDAQSLALSPDIIQSLEVANPVGETELLRNAVAAHLRSWQSQRRQDVEYGEIILTNRRGEVIAANTEPERLSYADQAWWKAAYADGTGAAYLSNIYRDDRHHGYYYEIAVPVLKPEMQHALGVLRVTVRRDKLLRAILEVRIGNSGHAMLVSSDGTPLICPILQPEAHRINDPLMLQISRPQAGWAVAADDAHGGHDSIVGFAPVNPRHRLNPDSLGQQAWYTFIRQHPDETYAPLGGLLTKVGLVGSGLALWISFLGFFAGRIIVRPIRMLKEEARAIGTAALALPTASSLSRIRPRLSKRIEVRTHDELEDLALAFNQMTDALEESIETIKKQQDELIQKEKLASVGQLVAALTHDLKNPLGVIRSSAQILAGRGGEEPVRKEMCHYIIEEVDRLTYRINDILRFARPRRPERRSVKVEDLLDRALWQFQAQGKKARGIRVHRSTDGDPLRVMVDPEQLNDALVNILVNACEAMSDDGNLQVQAGADGQGLVWIRISDDGDGIAPENLEKVFDAFFTTKDFGVGLGLTNVRRLVEENGGKIFLESEEGRGTTFRILLPAAEPVGAPEPTNEGKT